MKINLIWVGKTKERFIIDGIEKYLKMLKAYANVSITEIREEKGSDINKMIEKEGERILKLGVPYVLLDEKGKAMTSMEFSGFLQKQPSPLNLVTGGAYGVSSEVKESAAKTISLSPMTLTHEMSRLLLVEQLYRGFSIIKKRGYHH